MATIRAFRGVRYNPARVSDLSAVVSQPYDRVRYGLQEQYYRQSPYNVVRILRGKPKPGDDAERPGGPNVYTRARATYDRWVDIYWQEFIPLAHGIRLFGQFYNEVVRPEDPYEFMDLLASTAMLSTRRNQALARVFLSSNCSVMALSLHATFGRCRTRALTPHCPRSTRPPRDAEFSGQVHPRHRAGHADDLPRPQPAGYAKRYHRRVFARDQHHALSLR